MLILLSAVWLQINYWAVSLPFTLHVYPVPL